MKSNLVLLVAFLVACGGIQIGPTNPPVDPPITTDDPPVTPPAPEQCKLMCRRLSDLGCEEGKPVFDSDQPGPEGVPNTSCEEFCQTSEKRGAMINPRCVKLTEACEQIEMLRTRDPKTCPVESP